MGNPLNEEQMRSRAKMNAPHQLPAGRSPPSDDDYICWSRMQAEAGQGLLSIVARKERERAIGEGLFFWGVGNAPAALTNVLARAKLPVRVIFSIMKSRPKAIDVTPSRIVAWRRYIDEFGKERLLPGHTLVTSRADSASGPKRAHYALMCYSSNSLELQKQAEPFDPADFRNAGGTGAPVGNSQVTALLKRVSNENRHSDYMVNFEAQLVGGYWVRLTDPVLIDARKTRLVEQMPQASPGEWMEILREIRSGPTNNFNDSGLELLL